jgi:hypothetical protein
MNCKSCFDQFTSNWHPDVMPWRFLVFALSLTASTLVAQPVPDFKLQDVSITSPRRGTAVSPRDYIMQVSGFYFGEAT